ncbi:hypothetical protein [Pedobacter glucosidilyticus]|uniref:hypothetical protein n=1 Tax=Pedobacter glucosidilyticus TaxID=1122941 RepID=UPI0026EE095F|nr:hypothetical protein [Pedobacter glucosidilyticus]
MKCINIFLIAGLALGLLSCKKESPITDLGNTLDNNAHRATLRVTLNNRAPAIGDSIILTASTWHINDIIDKVEFSETIVEKYAVNLVLNNTTLNSFVDDVPVYLVVDSVATDNIYYTIINENNELNKFYETLSDAYVIRNVYKKFMPQDIKDAELINALSDEGFASLKDHLSRNINVLDYRALFPTAPASDISGGSLTAAGRANLNANLTRQLLINNALRTATKKGELITNLKVKVTSQNKAFNEVLTVFQAKY